MADEIKFQINNFKSIKNATLVIHKGLNILVGPNGAGKTCLFSAIRFIKDLIQFGVALAMAKAGGPKRVYHHDTNKITIALEFNYGKRTYKRKKCNFMAKWELSVTQDGEDDIAIIKDESLRIFLDGVENNKEIFSVSIKRDAKGDKYLYFLADVNEYGLDLFGSWERDFSKKNKVSINKIFKDAFPELGKLLKNEPDKSLLIHMAPLDASIGKIIGCFRRLNEYNILPGVARSSVEQLPYARMESDGGGVAEVVDALEKKTFHKIDFSISNVQEEIPYFDRYKFPHFSASGGFFFFRGFSRFGMSQKEREGLMGALDKIQSEISAGVRPINKVSTQIDHTNGKRFLVFETDNDVFYPEEVSDGTVKWLCILVSIYVPNAKIYLLEEPENFLHPWMQQRLIQNMRHQAEASDTYYLLTSHSTTILNASYPRELRIVKSTQNGTVVEDLPNIDEIEKALVESDFGLGDLWISGAIDGVPSYEG